MNTALLSGTGANGLNEAMQDDDFCNLVNEALTLLSNGQISSNKQLLNSDVMIKSVREVAIKSKTPPGKVFAGICCTLQAGGTSRGKHSNIKIRIGENEFESKVIYEILMKITKCSPRQIAEFLANDIVRIAEHYNITGNAYIYISKYHLHLLTQQVTNEKFWCADFQMDNTNCPEYI
jgi:hypothetical protein